MVLYVFERVRQYERFAQLLVATDDLEIRRLIETAGGRVFFSEEPFRNGSERCAAAVRDIDCEIVVNVQGDEVMIEPEYVDRAVTMLEQDRGLVMSTLAFPIAGELVDSRDRNLVKVAVDQADRARDFSRQPINLVGEKIVNYGHAGVYVYRKEFLLKYAQLSPTPREQSESLEQLRVLESGFPIGVAIIDKPLLSVNSPEDLAIANKLLRDEGGTVR